ncbi:MAG: hypothetical protein JXR68_08280 [Bacteroidales bacterium]|nr:hypothetical protein [Bacteroidales bacterium]
MQTELKINIDDKTMKYAEKYANRKGFSVNEMLEYYLKWIVWNETFFSDVTGKNTIFEIKTEKNNWNELESFLSKNRFNLPENYSFNRNELYDR